MSVPTVKAIGPVIHFDWLPEQVSAMVNRPYTSKDGTTKAEVRWSTTAGGHGQHLHHSQVNLLSTSAKKTLAKELTERYNHLAWMDLIEQLCIHSLHHIRLGEPVKKIDTSEPIPPPQYLIRPIIRENKPTILWGKGGTGKSTLAIFLSMCVTYPWVDNPIARIEVCDEPTNVLYLDWETDSEDVTHQWQALERGHGLPASGFFHRLMSRPLVDDMETIQEMILENKIGLIIIDSIGGAAMGDLNSSEIATRTMMAVRQLKTTALLIAHPIKDQEKANGPQGSAFWTNMARSVWELSSDIQPQDNEWNWTLWHRKVNLGKLEKPIGIHVRYTETEDGPALTLSRQTIAQITESQNKQAAIDPNQHMGDRIILYITKKGQATAKDIAAGIDADVESVKPKLSDLKKAGWLDNNKPYWALSPNRGAQHANT